MLEAIGVVVGAGMLATTFKIAHELGSIRKGLSALVKIVDDHEARLRVIERKD